MAYGQSETIIQALVPIVGEAGVIPYQAWSASQQEQVTQAVYPKTSVDCVVYPRTQAELAQVVACANRNQWRLLPCGRGSKLSWGGLPEGINLIVSTERLNRLIDHAAGDLTVTVEAGMMFSQLQAILAKERQFLALDPAYNSQATVGGIIATADTGSLRHRYGGVRDMGLGASFVRADGQAVKAGGRVVKNVAGYDLMKLLTGSFGTLGILSQVTLRLFPLPEASKTVLLTGTATAIAQARATLLTSTLTPTAVDLLSTQATASLLGMGQTLGLIARFQSLQKSVDQQADRLLKLTQTLGLDGTTLVETEEDNFWQQVQNQFWSSEARQNHPVICKVGVLPAQAVAALTTMDAIADQQGVTCMGLIHAGSGLGIVRLEGGEEAALQAVLALRHSVSAPSQRSSGFVTVLEAPITLKQQLDVWGYTGNALGLMRKIKQQFDPKNLLSPNRFVGGI
jgi:glycolate oxidase FAD binding subunit